MWLDNQNLVSSRKTSARFKFVFFSFFIHIRSLIAFIQSHLFARIVVSQHMILSLLSIADGHKKDVFSVQCSKETIVSGGLDKNIKVWDVETGECVRTWPAHKGWVCTYSFWFVCHFLTLFSLCFFCYDYAYLDWIVVYIYAAVVRFNQNSKCAVSGGERSVKVWDLRTGQLVKKLKGHTSTSNS